MKHKVTTAYASGMSFETDIDGFKLVIDAAPENGGSNEGPRPKPLMLAALAGCTGIDVVSILKKMRVEFESFDIDVEADVTEEHPKHYFSMHIIYRFKGENLEMEKLEKAVSLSMERYCGVSAVYRKAMPVTHEIQILK